ncbi:MTF2 (YDL044C) [Zygosaccharomyces parabailii]|uniref:BN860_09956g1_1 n=1 Tax=Zygosaccharomyces bailii (strain CLIB 213 / ATCC 58445 / CBS 680 / BCRC 21525 / NBRC 1098 / NCYC 1416 / NRRL Y-2227) TaxID=1333698 RepID=A0A8J2X599_ZYGB2|nr:MTF2 (YDL044C) [Zygosaccharomyces parabailii]CDF87592.1 BN860_09956g1_1 [Zygosaccharomyces bailii CLIB 213]CDH15353.1 uncharacterized protein ZBAI_07140 [Zygosaccharomyces bailii ISA1307]
MLTIKPSFRNFRNFSTRFRCLQQQKEKVLGDKPTVAGHFKDEEDLASVPERSLFDQVFENIMRKEDARKKNSEEILRSAQNTTSVDAENEDSRGLQIVFENKNKGFTPEDQKLLDFFKNTSGSKVSKSAKLTRDDIRNYPVSLIANFEEAHEKLAQPYPKLKFNQEILRKLEDRERLKATLSTIMKPYVDTLIQRAETDYDFFIIIKELIKVFTKRDQNLDIGDQLLSAEILQQIKQNCIEHPDQLPAPYQVTLPYTVVKLLTSLDLDFPSERKYTIASYIYQECKRSPDVSLYLNVCNVDFYNVLLQLSWENYHDINQLKQLTAEMSINGIMGDLYTVEMLDKVCHDLKNVSDGIPEEESSQFNRQMSTTQVVWCRETDIQIRHVENYLRRLKENLA